MSSFYDDASLVVIPSGYKTSKIYAQKPTDGTGDLTFTRASGATRVGPNGLIEEVRTNLLTYSEDFANAAWTKGAVTATSNSTTAPNGTTTADTITETATTAQHVFFNSFTTSASIATYSIYLKANGRNFATVYPQGTSMAGYATIDLSNGTINTTGGSTFLRAAIESAGNGWYRVSVALTTTANSLACVVYLSNTLGGVSPSYAGDGTSGIFAWGAQLETGDIATNYIPTTTAAVSVGPVSNVPRLDYTNSSCPRLLLEPQRTNVCLFSEQLNNAAWTKLETNITANDAVSPDGYTNADKFIANTNNAAHVIYQGVASGTYTFSIYAKAAGENVFSMWLNDFSKRAVFDLSSGTVTTSNVTSSSITSVGNGWYRCTVYDTSTTSFVAIYGRNAESYAGNGTSGFLFWGAQCEAGAYATSYIPTLAASVTRVADAASKTGISSLIGQTEGTLYAEFNVGGADGRVMSTLGGSNRFGMTASPTAVGAFIVTAAGGVVYSTSASFTHGATTKMAFAYKSGQSVLYVNGSAVLTTTASFAFDAAITDLFLSQQEFSPGAGQSGKSQSQALLFKTRLTNAQLAELTTL
jgi:hypothetical protein